MQINALKTFRLTGMTKLTGGRAQINTPSLDISLCDDGIQEKTLWFSLVRKKPRNWKNSIENWNRNKSSLFTNNHNSLSHPILKCRHLCCVFSPFTFGRTETTPGAPQIARLLSSLNCLPCHHHPPFEVLLLSCRGIPASSLVEDTDELMPL